MLHTRSEYVFYFYFLTTFLTSVLECVKQKPLSVPQRENRMQGLN